MTVNLNPWVLGILACVLVWLGLYAVIVGVSGLIADLS